MSTMQGEVRLSKHAASRAKQRAIPDQVVNWLLLYGAEKFDGRGGVVRFFDARARTDLRSVAGNHAAGRMACHLRAYLIESSHDGVVITVGRRTRRIFN